MSKNNSVQPEDILPDGVDSSLLAGRVVKKGTIAAFLANIDILESPITNGKQKDAAIQTMKELAPSVIAIGLHKHVTFNNSQAEKILIEALTK